MDFRLASRPKSNDFDLLGDDRPVAQVISSMNGFTVYLLGGVGALLGPFPSSDLALSAFEDWATLEATAGTLDGLQGRAAGAGSSSPIDA